MLLWGPSTPTEHLILMRRKKRIREDIRNEVLQAGAASDCEQRAWRADGMERGKVDRRNASRERGRYTKT